MTFGEAVKAGFQNYVNFTGRAIRSEFWYWALFVFLVSIATSAIDYVLFPEGWVAPSALWSAWRCSCRICQLQFGDCTISTAAAGGFCWL